jgi:hypothetical protein
MDFFGKDPCGNPGYAEGICFLFTCRRKPELQRKLK